jgi:hypothetical protein
MNMAENQAREPVKKDPVDRVVHDWAYFDGEDHPRCQASPSKTKDKELRQVGANGAGLVVAGTWGCALPEGHEKFKNSRHHPHSWIRIGD